MNKMKKINLLIFTFILIFLTQCKYLEDTTVGRYYHNISSHYNIYFNANEILKTVIITTESSHYNNFNNILDVYMFGNNEILKKNSSQSDNILKKCAKIFEKHPTSKWIDDTYVLTGKAYFYKGDFYAAMESFNYVQTKYKNTYIAYESMIWISLCNIMLNKYDEAQAQLSLIKSEKDFPKKLQKELMLTQAFVNIRLEDYPSALEALKIAIPKEKKRNYKTRYMFILAQLCQKLDRLDEAVTLYHKVIKRNPDYEMVFNSKINLVACYDYKDEKNVHYIRKSLLKMLKDDKNIQYQDQIYFELALLESRLGNQNEMERYLRLSLEKTKSNENQKALAFLMLGNYYYEHSSYMLAKNYFDSCSTFITQNHPDYKKIKERTRILGKLTSNLMTIQIEDSLLYMATLNPKSLDSLVNKAYEQEQKLINQKIKKEQEAKRSEEQNYNFNSEIVRNNNLMTQGGPNTTSNWYFSNPQNVSLGVSEFNIKWGKRKLEDDWRRKKKNSSILTDGNDNEAGTDTIKEDEEKVVLSEDDIKVINERTKNISPEKLKYYTDIPFTAKLQEVSKNKILNAYKNAGDIYLDELMDTTKAIETYEKILSRFPNSKYETELHYSLYILYSKLNEKVKSNYHKNIILEKFPDSDYAIYIKDPDFFTNNLRIQNTAAKGYYDMVYESFLSGNCPNLIDSVKKAKTLYPYSSYFPKMEYLRIICAGKDTTKTAFIAMLSEFVKKYKSSEVMPHAQNLLTYLEENDTLKKEPRKEKVTITSPYIFNPTSPHYFILLFSNSESKLVKNGFSNYNAEFHELDELTINAIVLNNEKQILIIKEFANKEDAVKYFKEIDQDDLFKKKIKIQTSDFFIISTPNFSTFLNLKDINQYKDFFKSNYKM